MIRVPERLRDAQVARDSGHPFRVRVEDADELRVRVVEDDLDLVADVHVVEAERRDAPRIAGAMTSL